MSTVDDRIVLAAGWLHANLVRVDDAHAGWGWSPDVSPNPQDTAEAVCALTAARAHTPVHLLAPAYDVPEPSSVTSLLRLGTVTHATQGEWTFDSPVDAAWRLRALVALSAGGVFPDVHPYRQALLTAQDPHSGGWTMSDGLAPVSVTSTTAAIRALLELPDTDAEATIAIRRGCDYLINALLHDDPQATTNFATEKLRAFSVPGHSRKWAIPASHERMRGRSTMYCTIWNPPQAPSKKSRSVAATSPRRGITQHFHNRSWRCRLHESS